MAQLPDSQFTIHAALLPDFLVALAVLFDMWMLGPMQATVVNPWTASVARVRAALVPWIDPSVIFHDRILQSVKTEFSVSIDPFLDAVGGSAGKKHDPYANRTIFNAHTT